MPMSVPGYLTPRALSAALSKAAHAMAFAVIICGSFSVLGFAAASPGVLWPALIAMAVMAPVFAWLSRSSRILTGVVALAVGGAAAYVYALTFALELPEVVAASLLWLAPPKLVLLLIAGVSQNVVRALAWIVSGYVVAEGAVLLALSHAGFPPVPDPLVFTVLISVIATWILAFASARTAVRTHPRLQRAAREEFIDDLRFRMELRAAALMHDTILNHLGAIAASSERRLRPEQREEIERDLQVLIDQEWLHAHPDVDAESSADDRVTPLREAITEVRAQGLEVTGTGDFGSVARLSVEQAHALGLAAKQCLVNVVKHSGVMKAEVAVYSSQDEVSVMIIDAGRGFVDSAVGTDRLGLRASVQSRIQSVGGLVQVWSTPGSGTSILIQFPIGGAAGGPSLGSGSQAVVSGPLPTDPQTDSGTAQ